MAKYVKTYNEDLQLVGMQDADDGKVRMFLAVATAPNPSTVQMIRGQYDSLKDILFNGGGAKVKITLSGELLAIVDANIAPYTAGEVGEENMKIWVSIPNEVGFNNATITRAG